MSKVKSALKANKFLAGQVHKNMLDLLVKDNLSDKERKNLQGIYRHVEQIEILFKEVSDEKE